MQTTYQQQIEAIGRAMTERASKLKREGSLPSHDKHWKALNDAASTIASINLSPNPESVALKAKSDSLI